MAASDFLLRYQDMAGPIPNLSFFEYGWELAFSVITVLLLFEGKKRAEDCGLFNLPAPLHSLRVITAAVTLASLLVFVFLTSWFLSFLKVATASNAWGVCPCFHLTLGDVQCL